MGSKQYGHTTPTLLGPMVGRHRCGHIIRAFSGMQNGKKTRRPHNPCLLVVPIVRRKECGYITPPFWGV